MKLNKLALGFLVLGVALIGVVLFKGGGKLTKQLPLQEALKQTLPLEAQGKILVNQDRVNVGKQYISVIHNIQDDSKAKETISKFIYQAFSRLDSKEMENISAVNIVLYQMLTQPKDANVKPQTKQYRILIGSNVAKKQPNKFWEAGNQGDLFKWLTATCPTTDSRNLTDFCDISASLKE